MASVNEEAVSKEILKTRGCITIAGLHIKPILLPKIIMMRITAFFLTALVMFIGSTTYAFGQGHVIDSSKRVELIYVISAKSGSYNQGILTLEGISTVVYFSDKPSRIAGQMSLEKFINLWQKNFEPHEKMSPNATLSIYIGTGLQNATLELSDPKLNGDSISYKAKPLESTIPPKFNASSLFLDGFINPQIKDSTNL